ncbi:MAG: LCP family protein [Oscillospiraceae bacterium]|nr:LCP family protein [Oscillospiraceae bacterium]
MSAEKKTPAGEPANTQSDRKALQKRAMKTALITMAITLAICLTVIFSVDHYLNKIQYDTGKTLPQADQLQAEEPAMRLPEPIIEEPLDEEELLRRTLEGETELIAGSSNVMNILLLGSDTRAAGKASTGRTDSIIMLSINPDSKRIVMTSFMRDMYVKIPGYESNRINVPYLLGGAPLLEKVIESNFGLPTDRYVTVDFYCFMDIVNIFGGIDQELSAEEIRDMQRIIQEMNELTGDARGTDLLPSSSAGTYHLNGKQALAYARSRYSSGGDSGRTQRQRNVLGQLFEKAKGLNLIQLHELMEMVLPSITTDMTKGEILSLLLKSKTYLSYELVSNRVPADGTGYNTMINEASVISVDFAANRKILADLIYGTQG